MTLFQILNASTAVKALLGATPLRVYPWTDAPPKVEKPYATYGIYNGLPENYLDRAPDIDNEGTQIDIWAETGDSCEDCFTAIRDALEAHGHVTSYQKPDRDFETKLYHSRIDIDLWQNR